MCLYWTDSSEMVAIVDRSLMSHIIFCLMVEMSTCAELSIRETSIGGELMEVQ